MYPRQGLLEYARVIQKVQPREHTCPGTGEQAAAPSGGTPVGMGTETVMALKAFDWTSLSEHRHLPVRTRESLVSGSEPRDGGIMEGGAPSLGFLG